MKPELGNGLEFSDCRLGNWQETAAA